MKQKKIGDKLYVFSETPYVITEDTDADVIIIQLECLDGFAELNSDLADKMVPYNYHMFTVKPQEWSDYYDDYTITVASVTGGTLTASPMSADLGEEVTLTNTPDEGYEFTSYNVTCGGEPVTVTDNKFTMPLGDVTVSGTFVQNIPYEQQYFTIESEVDGNEITIKQGLSDTFYVSVDGGSTWQGSTLDQEGVVQITINTLDAGEKILVKKNTGSFTIWVDPESVEQPVIDSDYGFKVYGNVMSLIYGDNFVNQTSFPEYSSNNLMGLLMKSNVTDASNLILPTTTVPYGCYSYMFYDCTYLTAAPILPATNVSGGGGVTAYDNMFYGTQIAELIMLASNFGDGSTAPYNFLPSTSGTIYVDPNLNDYQRSVFTEDGWTVVNYAG